jgi:peptidyl-prolyl cis-trans isomerase D
MLRFIRSYAASWVVKILFLLLILSFAAWGIGDIFRLQRSSSAVATVGHMKIGREQVISQFDNELRRLQPLFNNRLDRDQARQMGLLDRALDQLVGAALLEQEADHLGVVAMDAAVRRETYAQPAFQNAQGQFDRALFERVLANNGFSEQSYVATVRQDLIERQVVDAVTGGVVVPGILAETLFRFRNERRSPEVAVLAVDATAAVPAPEGDTLKSWYEGHKDRFQAPEYRAITYVLLAPETLAATIAVSDEDIAAEYEQRKATLGRPETREARQVVVGEEALARKVAELSQTGVTLAAAARQAGAAAPVDLGTVRKDQLPAAVAEAIFATAAGHVSEPVKSPLGWHVIEVTKVEPGYVPSLAEVKDKIRHDLALNRAADKIADLSNAFEDALGGGATVEAAAKQVGFEAHKFAAVDANGRTPEGNAAEGLPTVPEFLATAFATEAGTESNLQDLGNGGYFMVRVDGVTPAQARPFDTVQDQVLAEWQAERRQEHTREVAEALAEKLRHGGDFARLAADARTAVKTGKPVLRDQAGEDVGLPATATAKLFQLKPDEVAVEPVDNGFAVLRLKEIVPAVPSSDPEGMKSIKTELQRSLENEAAAQYRNALRSRYPVAIDRAAVDALF